MIKKTLCNTPILTPVWYCKYCKYFMKSWWGAQGQGPAMDFRLIMLSMDMIDYVSVRHDVNVNVNVFFNGETLWRVMQGNDNEDGGMIFLWELEPGLGVCESYLPNLLWYHSFILFVRVVEAVMALANGEAHLSNFSCIGNGWIWGNVSRFWRK